MTTATCEEKVIANAHGASAISFGPHVDGTSTRQTYTTAGRLLTPSVEQKFACDESRPFKVHRYKLEGIMPTSKNELKAEGTKPTVLPVVGKVGTWLADTGASVDAID